MCMRILSVCVCVWESDEHPPLWLHISVPGNFTHWRLCLTDWGCYTEEAAHSVMLCIDAKLSLLRVSMLIPTWQSIHSPGVLLFLDTVWRCVSSSGSGKPGLPHSHNTHLVYVLTINAKKNLRSVPTVPLYFHSGLYVHWIFKPLGPYFQLTVVLPTLRIHSICLLLSLPVFSAHCTVYWQPLLVWSGLTANRLIVMP